jgi:hypothetical protein
MKRKIIALCIVGCFLLTALFGMSSIGMKLEKTNDSSIEIIKPENNTDVHFPITVRSKGSGDITYVEYFLYHNGAWFSGLWNANYPPYKVIITKNQLLSHGISIKYDLPLKIKAIAYNYGIGEIAKSDIIKVNLIKTRSVILLKHFLTFLSLPQELLNLIKQ